MSQNNAEQQKLVIGFTILAFVAMILLFVGVFMAMIAVASFVFYYWREVFRYEGGKPVLWLAIITGIAAIPLAGAALEHLRLSAIYLDRQNDKWVSETFTALIFIAAIALPTGAYWLFRKIKPVSHFRVNVIEMFHRQYKEHQITKADRDANIKKIIEMGDAALEKMIAESQRQASNPAPQAASGFDVPPQNP